MTQFGIVLLAAGNASRMGRPKQLLDFNGMPLIRHAASQAVASGCSPVVVVCGTLIDEIRDALAGLPVQVTLNDRWQEGMGTSIQCGLRELETQTDGEQTTSGVILALADQALVDHRVYQTLVAMHRETAQPIVSSHYSGTVGVPVLFTRDYFPHLMALKPSQGCKGVIQDNGHAVARFDCPDAAADIDTPEDYQTVLAEFIRRQSI